MSSEAEVSQLSGSRVILFHPQTGNRKEEREVEPSSSTSSLVLAMDFLQQGTTSLGFHNLLKQHHKLWEYVFT